MLVFKSFSKFDSQMREKYKSISETMDLINIFLLIIQEFFVYLYLKVKMETINKYN
jgi:hypothetical protein